MKKKLESSFSGEDEVVPEISEMKDVSRVMSEKPQVVEADGSKIETISVDWVTPDAVADNKDEELNVKWHDDRLQGVQARINYALSGGYDYPAGSIQISVPKKIFKDRDGNLIGTTKLAVLEAPDKSGDFAYVEKEDSYVFINTKKLSAATQGYMEMSFENLKPHTIKDKVTGYKTDDFSANITVQTKNGKELAKKSNDIHAVVDTRAWVSEASKRAYYRPREAWSDSYPSELKPSNDKDYVYMTYLSIPSIGLNTTIYDNSLEKSLNNGCGIIEGTGDILDTKNQNTILTSHNGSSVKDLFTNLEKMNVNDKFYIKATDNKIREYTIIDKRVVSPASELQYFKKPNKDEKYITLRTCTPTGINSHRLHVLGVFNKEIKKIPSPKFILSKFEVFLIVILIIALILLIKNIVEDIKLKKKLK